MLKNLRTLLFGSLFVLLAMLTLVSPALARDHFFFGPFHSSSPDSGTCGNNWANDTFNRSFEVSASDTSMFREFFTDGRFVTIAGPSPGACESRPNNGNTVPNGLKGSFGGFFDVVVTGGMFNPKASCTQATCDTTMGFVQTVYGSTKFMVTSFKLHYFSRCGFWQNASTDQGGNRGDIACKKEKRGERGEGSHEMTGASGEASRESMLQALLHTLL